MGVLGEKLEGHKLEKDDGNKKLFSKACVDVAKFPKRVGRAGFLFRPSFVAGDDYTFRAELDFTGLPNKATLNSDHGVVDEPTRVHVNTGTFCVKRFNHVAMLINWPARTVANPWAAIRGEFNDAHFRLDTQSYCYKKDFRGDQFE